MTLWAGLRWVAPLLGQLQAAVQREKHPLHFALCRYRDDHLVFKNFLCGIYVGPEAWHAWHQEQGVSATAYRAAIRW